MIEQKSDIFTAIVDLRSIGVWGLLLANSHRLRRSVFVEQLGWSSPCDDGEFEHDEFDTPSARYIIATHDGVTPLAMARIVPTTRPYMIEAIAERPGGFKPPKENHIWELSRLFADPALDIGEKIRALKALERGVARFTAGNGIQSLLCWASRATLSLARLTGHEYNILAELDDDEGNPTWIIEFEFSDSQFSDEFRKAMADETSPQKISKKA